MADINTTQMRDALAWATGDEDKAQEPSTNPFVWFWEAIEGDFNEDRSTAQLLVDAGISMIPLVDQVCDLRDLIANCRKLARDWADQWAWVALVLTLIGLFPTVGSLAKGVLKIFFGFVRRYGGRQVAKAVDDGMTWVITWLRQRDVQKYIRMKRIDQIFRYLATEIKAIGARVNVAALKGAMDRGIAAVAAMVDRVDGIPFIGARAKAALELVRSVRLKMDAHLAQAVRPVQDLIDTIVKRLELEALRAEHGIVDAANIHFRGEMPEAAAIALMRRDQPGWLSKAGDKLIDQADPADYRVKVDQLSAKVDASGKPRAPDEIFPYLSDRSIESFHTLVPEKIRGPARLYRILAPNSRAMSDCWVTEEIFRKLQSEADPKAAWRKYLAVWPHWNVDGQFVVYDIKAGESLNVWRGPASSQTETALPGFHLQGGWEQVVFNVERADARNDTVVHFPIGPNGAVDKSRPLAKPDVDALTAKMSDAEKADFFKQHIALRQHINHPAISGPFETGWGYVEFGGSGMGGKIGLPDIPGQTTNLR